MRAAIVALILSAFASLPVAAAEATNPPRSIFEVPDAQADENDSPKLPKLRRSQASISTQIFTGTAACCLVSVIPAGIFAAPTAAGFAVSRLNPRAGSFWPVACANAGALLGLVVGSVSLMPVIIFALDDNDLGELQTIAIFSFPYLAAYGFMIGGALLGDFIASNHADLSRNKAPNWSRLMGAPKTLSMAY